MVVGYKSNDVAERQALSQHRSDEFTATIRSYTHCRRTELSDRVRRDPCTSSTVRAPSPDAPRDAVGHRPAPTFTTGAFDAPTSAALGCDLWRFPSNACPPCPPSPLRHAPIHRTGSRNRPSGSAPVRQSTASAPLILDDGRCLIAGSDTHIVADIRHHYASLAIPTFIYFELICFVSGGPSWGRPTSLIIS